MLKTVTVEEGSVTDEHSKALLLRDGLSIIDIESRMRNFVMSVLFGCPCSLYSSKG